MTTLYDILETIEDDLNTNFTNSNGFEEIITFKRGVFSWEDCISKPAIYFTLVSDEVDENEMAGFHARWLNLIFYGYAITENGETSKIYEMVDGLKTFLNSAYFTYSENSLIGNVEIKEGSVTDTINYFIMDVRLLYDA
jgi:hypothetical protein